MTREVWTPEKDTSKQMLDLWRLYFTKLNNIFTSNRYRYLDIRKRNSLFKQKTDLHCTMFESTAHQSLFKAKSCTTRFGIIFTRKAKTIYMSINILLKFILSTSVQCSTTVVVCGFQFNLWPLQSSLLPLRAMVLLESWGCGLYTSFYGTCDRNFF